MRKANFQHALLRCGLICVGLVLAIGCSDGTSVLAPPVEQLQTSCPTIDQSIPNTLEALKQGRLEPLRTLVGAFEVSQGGRRIDAIARAIVALLRAIPPEVTEAFDVAFINGIVREAEPLLATLVTPLAALDPMIPSERDKLLVFDAAAEFIQTCPEGSLTGVVGLLTSDVDLLSQLRLALKDPGLREILANFPPPDGSESNRLGFAILIDTLLGAVLSTNFEFDALLRLIDPFFPIDEPPLGSLLVELRPLLTGQGLAALRTAAECIDATERTDSAGVSQDGGRLVGGLLYDLLTFQGGDLVGLLDSLEPLLIRTADPALLQLVDTLLAAIQNDSELRATLLATIAFALEIERVPLLLQGFDAMLQIGTLGELIQLVDAVILSSDCTDGTETLAEQLLHAFTLSP